MENGTAGSLREFIVSHRETIRAADGEQAAKYFRQNVTYGNANLSIAEVGLLGDFVRRTAPPSGPVMVVPETETAEMTTELLIEILKQHPGKRVLINGYEGGFDNPEIKILNVAERRNQREWDGKYEDMSLMLRPFFFKTEQPFNAVVLSRDFKNG